MVLECADVFFWGGGGGGAGKWGEWGEWRDAEGGTKQKIKSPQFRFSAAPLAGTDLVHSYLARKYSLLTKQKSPD